MRRLMRSQLTAGAVAALTSAVVLGLPATGAQAAGAPARAPRQYTALIMNDQFPTSNSVTKVTGTGSSWRRGRKVVIAQGSIGLDTLAFTPNGKTAYVLEGNRDVVVPVTVASMARGRPFPAGVRGPYVDAVTPNGKWLVVTGYTSNTVALIGLPRHATVRRLKVGTEPLGLAVLPDGKAAYVVNYGSGTVSVVSLSGTPKVTATITMPHGCVTPWLAVAAPDSKTVWVSCKNSWMLWPITVATNAPAASGIKIPTGFTTANGGLQWPAITPNGKTIYVASGNDVYPVTVATRRVGRGIHMPNAASVAVSPGGAYVMTGRNDNGCGCYRDAVEVIRVSDNKVVARFSSGGYEHFFLAFQP